VSQNRASAKKNQHAWGNKIDTEITPGGRMHPPNADPIISGSSEPDFTSESGRQVLLFVELISGPRLPKKILNVPELHMGLNEDFAYGMGNWI